MPCDMTLVTITLRSIKPLCVIMGIMTLAKALTSKPRCSIGGDNKASTVSFEKISQGLARHRLKRDFAALKKSQRKPRLQRYENTHKASIEAEGSRLSCFTQ